MYGCVCVVLFREILDGKGYDMLTEKHAEKDGPVPNGWVSLALGVLHICG